MEPQKNANPASDEDKATTSPTETTEDTNVQTAPAEDVAMSDSSTTAPQDEPSVSVPDSTTTSDSSVPVGDVALGGGEQSVAPDMAAPTPGQPAEDTPSVPTDTTPPVAPAAPDVSMPPADNTPDFQSPLGGTTVTPGDTSSVPPTAPVPATHGDKRTVLVLLGVAVVLLAAIAVLYFFV